MITRQDAWPSIDFLVDIVYRSPRKSSNYSLAPLETPGTPWIDERGVVLRNF